MAIGVVKILCPPFNTSVRQWRSERVVLKNQVKTKRNYVLNNIFLKTVQVHLYVVLNCVKCMCIKRRHWIMSNLRCCTAVSRIVVMAYLQSNNISNNARGRRRCARALCNDIISSCLVKWKYQMKFYKKKNEIKSTYK